MKIITFKYLFDYSWEEVSTANWRKYCPWNEKSTHVVAVDILSRGVDAHTGNVSIEIARVLRLTVRLILAHHITFCSYELSA